MQRVHTTRARLRPDSERTTCLGPVRHVRVSGLLERDAQALRAVPFSTGCGDGIVRLALTAPAIAALDALRSAGRLLGPLPRGARGAAVDVPYALLGPGPDDRQLRVHLLHDDSSLSSVLLRSGARGDRCDRGCTRAYRCAAATLVQLAELRDLRLLADPLDLLCGAGPRQPGWVALPALAAGWTAGIAELVACADAVMRSTSAHSGD